MSLTLSDAELQELTGYRRAAEQLAELLRQGFWRARRGRDGSVILERAHFEAVNESDAKRFDYTTIVPPQQFHAASVRRAAALLKRTPKWADMASIEAIYEEARRISAETGVPHHVDHEIPLQGRIVSGLHVPSNLRIITGADNIAKSNRFEVEC